jgi:two-component system, cell cycle sensor histidine kinase and response regulator CckA
MMVSNIVPRKFGTRLIIMILFAGLLPIVIFGLLLNVFGNRFTAEMSTTLAEGEMKLLEGGEAVLQKMAENQIRQKTIDVANQLDLYLEAHREKTLQNLQDDPRFREIAIQPVGETGYTAIHESNTAKNRFHKNPEIENKDLRTLADKLPDFWSIMEASLGGERSGGYYRWQEADGTIREKFMYIVPLREMTADGVPLGVAATTYFDEFTQPIIAAKAAFRDSTLHLSNTVDDLILSSEKVGFSLMGVSFVLVLMMAYWLGVYFSRAITQLRQAIREVNQGNMNVGLKPLMSGEVGELTRDFNEMVAHLAETMVSKARLEESEHKLRTIVEHSTNLFYSHTPDHVLTYMSPRTREYLECEPEEALIRWTEFVTDNPINRQGFEHTQRAIDTGERQPPFELELKGKKGRRIWVEVNESPVVQGGDTVAIVGALIDITERKRAEDALRESELFLKETQKIARVGGWMANPHTDYLKWTDGVYEIIGASRDYTPTLSEGIKFFLPQYIPVLNKSIADCLATGEPFSTECQVTTTDGRALWAEVRGLAPVLDGGRSNVLGTFQDITERKLAEKEWRETLELLHAAIEQSPSGILIADAPNVRIRMANPTALGIRGKTDQSLVGIDVTQHSANWQTFHPDETPYLSEELPLSRAILRGEVTQNEELIICSEDGERHWVTVNAAPVRNPAGEITSGIVIFHDITEHKRAEEEKAHLQAQLTQAQKMESVGRLAGGVAHDFNNKIQAILGYASLSLSETSPESPVHQWLMEVQKAAQQSADLTRQLLAFARKQTIRLQVIDLNETVSGLLKMLQRIVGEDIELHWMSGRALWNLNMDPAQIDQILVNLVVNSRDAISGTGTIRLKTENFSMDTPFCAVHAGAVPGDYVLLTVSDNGCGMNEEILERVFEPFFTTKELGKGTGLGLATVYGIVKQNKGFIDVESKPGEGTAFRIYLPRFEGKATGVRIETSDDRPPRGTETVLIVEDEETIMILGRTILQRQGYRVLTANTPGKAIRLAEEYEGVIHLLITDVVMPEMNGRELSERLTLLKPGLKCLFMSGYTANVIAQHGVLDEEVRFIQKPFSVNDLSKTVREILEG